MNPATDRAWRRLQWLWLLVGIVTTGLIVAITYLPEGVRSSLRGPLLTLLSILSEGEPSDSDGLFLLPAVGVAALGTSILLRIQVRRWMARERRATPEEILQRLYPFHVMLIALGAITGLSVAVFCLVTANVPWLVAMTALGAATWVVVRPGRPSLHDLTSRARPPEESMGERAENPPVASPPSPLSFRQAVAEVTAYALWSIVLFWGLVESMRIPGLGEFGAPARTAAVGLVIGIMALVASVRPPHPRTVNIIGWGTTLLLGFGFIVWPVLAGVRASTRSRVRPTLVFIATSLGAVCGWFAAFS